MLKQKYTKMHLGATFLGRENVRLLYCVRVRACVCVFAYMLMWDQKRGNVEGYMFSC